MTEQKRRGGKRFNEYTPEEQSELSRRGAEKSNKVQRNRREIKKMLENMDETRQGAIAEYIHKNPEAIDQLYAMMFNKALEGEKWAAELIINSTGLSAPKKTEAKVTAEEMSVDDAQKVLQEAMKGAKVVGWEDDK